MSLARNDRPLAATAGSPGTALFLPPPTPSRAHAPRPPPSASPPKLDRVPAQWSFETSYGIYGAAGGAVVPTHHERAPRAPSAMSMGGWFVRRRDRDKAKALARARSVDAPDVRAVPAEPAPPARSPPLRALPPPPPDPAPAHVSAPLPAIPASNAPTPRTSRAPSPVALPPPSFRPTSAHRPGSAAGFKPATRPRGSGSVSGSAPPLRAPPERARRRPATASGVPSEVFLGGSLGMYGIGSTSILALNGSSVSLAPNPGAFAPRAPARASARPDPPRPAPRKPSRAEARKAERLRGFVLKGDKRHHPRPREEAPYPRDYERKVLDHDVWDDAFARQLAGSGTYHTFATPPARVLDLGCGTGTWVLECARDWPAAHFVGLDLVPIQPAPAALPPDCAARVHWVHANFLDTLPFADGAFSFVHVRRIARGVPEDRWGALFEEVARVLEPGGALEVVEEDLFFPGSVRIGGGSGSGDAAPAPPPPADSSDDDAPPFHTAPADPRDHSVLERAYAEMHAARFINLTPLSVVHSTLVQYFRDVRSHPALQLAFPPPGPAPPGRLTRAALRDPAQHYVTLDTTLHDGGAAPALPNTAWHFDLGALNMHLSARAAEVLACAEEMWDAARARGLAREEWDECLARFAMDMQDKVGLAAALSERLAWRVRATPRTPERKAFDDAVARWERRRGAAAAPPGVPLSRRLRAFVAWKAA